MAEQLSDKEVQKFYLDVVLMVESKLCELTVTDGWSSRVQAEEIVNSVVNAFHAGKVSDFPMPWEHFRCKVPGE